jgi:hypothetical protein
MLQQRARPWAASGPISKWGTSILHVQQVHHPHPRKLWAQCQKVLQELDLHQGKKIWKTQGCISKKIWKTRAALINCSTEICSKMNRWNNKLRVIEMQMGSKQERQLSSLCSNTHSLKLHTVGFNLRWEFFQKNYPNSAHGSHPDHLPQRPWLYNMWILIMATSISHTVQYQWKN